MKSYSQHQQDYDDIPIELITPSKFNPRKSFNIEYIEELAKSLQRDGQWDPIIVRRKSDGKYELIAGECRLRAAKLAGLKSLKAKILDSDDTEALLLALKTNILRKDLNPVEEANALKALLDLKGNRKDVIKALNKSKRWIITRLKLADAAEGIKNAVLKEELSLLAAIKIAELPEGLQGPVASKAVRERLSIKEVKKLVELLKNAKTRNEIELLLQTPVRDYMRSPPYSGKRLLTLRQKERKPTIVSCDCGAHYIIDWVNGRIVGEKVINNEYKFNIKDH